MRTGSETNRPIASDSRSPTRPRSSIRRWGMARREAIEGYVCISPWIVGFLVFTLGPMVASMWLSLTNYAVVAAPRFIGFANYARIADEPLFWASVENTLYYTVAFVPASIVGSLICALLLNQSIRLRGLFRSVYFLPSVTPAVAAMFLWMWILQPRVGFLNYALSWVGIQGPGWLGSPKWSKPALILVSLWRSVGGNTMLIFLAGLQGVPLELQEAAEIDGAGVWQRFRGVTLPMISPTIFFNLVLGMISALQIFDLAYVASAPAGQQSELGGPAHSTLFYVLNLYIRTFQDWDMGMGSALAWVFFLGVMILTLLQLHLARDWVYYEAAGGDVRW
jgi:multiple sugar transport system permease protein